MQSLRDGYSALVIGASGAIGAAFQDRLRADSRCAGVIGLSRSGEPALVLEQQASIARCADHLRALGPLHLVIDATGALTIDGRGPEKRIDQLDAAALLRAVEVNAIGPALLLKHFAPLLARGERVIWAKLSARVGSIEDNRKGGWYGYRASKAALNMLLQTSAIEYGRRAPNVTLLAYHPGTVDTPLSAPFHRSVPEGALFVALRGEHFDGHDFIHHAAAAGACRSCWNAEVRP